MLVEKMLLIWLLFSMTLASSASLSEESLLQQIQVHHHHGKFGQQYSAAVDNGTQHTWEYSTSVGPLEPDQENNQLSLSFYLEVDDDNQHTMQSPVSFQLSFQQETLQVILPMKSPSSGRIYSRVRRTLCTPLNYTTGQTETTSPPPPPVFATVSSSNPANTTFRLTLQLENNLVKFNEIHRVHVESNSPALYKLSIPPNYIPSARYALLRVRSTDHTCITVSIQSPECPVLDQETNVKFQGVHHTMSRAAAITIKMSELEEGRHLLLVLHEHDADCDSTHQLEKDHVFPDIISKRSQQDFNNMLENKRTKQLEFTLVEKIPDSVYVYSTLGVLFILLLFCGAFSVLYFKFLRIQSEQSEQAQQKAEVGVNEASISSASNRVSTSSNNEVELCCFFFLVTPNRQATFLSSGSSSVESSPSQPTTLEDSCKKCHVEISKSARRYSGTLFVAGAFYTLPVLQFVILYQRVLAETGNEDLCYHNFQCNHFLGGLAAFNHMYSNVGYIVLGIYFTLIVWVEERKYNSELHLRHQCGIHAHFGIFYAMGSALVLQGMLSAMYHVCPTHLSYEFDTFFMYVTAVLCLVKIHQGRHPDSNASAFLAFICLAFILALVLTAIIFHAWYFWMLITIAHVLVVFLTSIHIYSCGNWRFDCTVLRTPLDSTRLSSIITPFQNSTNPSQTRTTMILTATNLLNWAVAALGVSSFYRYGDVSSHLLVIFLVNLGLYFSVYIWLKVKNGERILWHTKLYLGLSLPIWVAGLYTFSKWPANWELSQAESRTLNEDCLLLHFYDIHDVWHFLSAFGMFFMFMFFFTLDDDLKLVKRSNIKVF